MPSSPHLARNSGAHAAMLGVGFEEAWLPWADPDPSAVPDHTFTHHAGLPNDSTAGVDDDDLESQPSAMPPPAATAGPVFV